MNLIPIWPIGRQTGLLEDLLVEVDTAGIGAERNTVELAIHALAPWIELSGYWLHSSSSSRTDRWASGWPASLMTCVLDDVGKSWIDLFISASLVKHWSASASTAEDRW